MVGECVVVDAARIEPVSTPNCLANREKNREFRGIRPTAAGGPRYPCSTLVTASLLTADRYTSRIAAHQVSSHRPGCRDRRSDRTSLEEPSCQVQRFARSCLRIGARGGSPRA